MVKKTKSKKDKANLLPRFIMAFGIIFMVVSFSWKLNQSSLGFNEKPEVAYREINLESKKPISLKIAKTNTNLLIEASEIINGNWQVSKNGVSFLNSSAVPGEDGNIVIYGHNKEKILGSLDTLKSGDDIEIITRDNVTHKYIVKKIETVSPTQIEVINPTSSEVLTIYTCTGLFDSKRLVVKAEPV